MLADQPAELEPAHAGHHDVRKHQIDVAPLVEDFDGGLGGGGAHHAETALLGVVGGDHRHLRMILDEQHGGRIGVDAPPDGGSAFWFTLPESGQPVVSPSPSVTV